MPRITTRELFSATPHPIGSGEGRVASFVRGGVERLAVASVLTCCELLLLLLFAFVTSSASIRPLPRRVK